jgi:monoamine oxidase
VSDRRYFEDYAPGVTIGSARRTVTETDILVWSGLVGDFNPAHVDIVHAATTPFGQRIAHGNIAFNLSVSLALGKVPGDYRPEGFIRLAGWEKVRFTAPVFIGDTLRAERTLEAMEDGPDADSGVLVFSVRVIKDQDETVMVGTERLLVRRAPTDERKGTQ